MLDLLICRDRSTTVVDVLARAVQSKAVQSLDLSADSASERWPPRKLGEVPRLFPGRNRVSGLCPLSDLSNPRSLDSGRNAAHAPVQGC